MMMPKATAHAGIGRMSALGANRTRRDVGNDVNDPERSFSHLRPLVRALAERLEHVGADARRAKMFNDPK